MTQSAAKPILFSVVIATYNRRDYLLEAIKSVKEQTYPVYEIIVVSDGSQDCTAEAVRELYPEVIVFEQPNLGQALAQNTGIALATGDWVCFLDDDDLWHREKLEYAARYISTQPDCCAINNPIWFFSDRADGPKGGFGFVRDFVASNLAECHKVAGETSSSNDIEYLSIKGNSFRLLLEKNRGVMSSSMVRREILIRAGCFCPMQTCGQDWTMFLNVARLCEWHTLPQRLGFTRLHGSQSSTDSSNSLDILAGQINAWYSGRPLPERTRDKETRAQLIQYGPVYRLAIQNYYWGALRNRQFKLARLLLLAGKMLLPKRRDYFYVLIPPPISWRWERYILGMHK